MATKKAVWNFSELKDALLVTSHNKCAYCECGVSEEAKYVEVEHFRDKDRYPQDVVSWSNLLPACKRCNGNKGTHDTVADPIIDPYAEDPRLHLTFRLYRFNAQTPLGRSTIDVLDLNETDRLVQVRFEIGEELLEGVAGAKEKLEKYEHNQSLRSQNALHKHVRLLLAECQPPAEYCATAATVLHGDSGYLKLRDRMVQLNLWTSELQSLHDESQSYVIDSV